MTEPYPAKREIERYEEVARRPEGEANAHESDAALCRRHAEEARKTAEYIRKNFLRNAASTTNSER